MGLELQWGYGACLVGLQKLGDELLTVDYWVPYRVSAGHAANHFMILVIKLGGHN